MKREQDTFDRSKKKRQKERKRSWFDDDGFNLSKKDLQNQYKRKQKYRKLDDWDT
jgi:hypothetical protein